MDKKLEESSTVVNNYLNVITENGNKKLNKLSETLYDQLGTNYENYVKKAKTYHDAVDQIVHKELTGLFIDKINWLDVGSAEGNRITKIIEKYNTNLTCIDNSEVMVNLMKEKGLKAFAGDISNKYTLSFSPQEFNIISMLYNVLGQIETPVLKEAALLNIHNVLKDDGVLIFDVSNKWNFKRYKKINVLKSIFLDIFGLDDGDFKLTISVGDKQFESMSHCFTYFEVKKLLKKCGFKIHKKYFVNYRTGVIENNLFSGQILIFAKKT
jgi:SAM-dependent methyltransferase